MVLILEIFILILIKNDIKIHGKKLIDLKNIDPKVYASDYYHINVNKYGVKSGTSLKFRENKVEIIKQILMVGFSGILGIG